VEIYALTMFIACKGFCHGETMIFIKEMPAESVFWQDLVACWALLFCVPQGHSVLGLA
jgi:hypothetical protein